MTNYNDLLTGIAVFELLNQLDVNFFSVWRKDLFKNVTHLNSSQFDTLVTNNWTVIYKALKAYIEKESFNDSYVDDINLDLIAAGDKKEFFGFFLVLISILVMRKSYFWNQSLGKVQNSNSYNLLKNLEKTLNVTEEEEEEPMQKITEANRDQDENQTLIDMITDLERKLKVKSEEVAKLVHDLSLKQDEIDEVRKLHEQKTFDAEKMRMRLEALEQEHKEYFEALAFQKDLGLLTDQVKKLEKREEDLEMENSFLRDKINEQDKKIKELKEVESKYLVDENIRKKFDMVLERNENFNTEMRKKELEIEGLKYQVELLKKNKDAIENALIASKNEKIKLDLQISTLNEELRSKDQEISNQDRILARYKESHDLYHLNMQNSSPVSKTRRRLRLL